MEGIGRLLQTGVTPAGVRRVDVYELSDGQPVRVAAADASGRSTSETHAASDALAAGVAKGSASIAHQPLASGSELVQAGALVIDPVTRRPAGVVVASEQLTGKLTIESQRIIAAYENYSRLRFLTRPLQGMYLSLFLMMTLMILVSATWMGLYLAKRITRPVHMLAQGAREIGAGHLDHRIEPETRDEFGSLIEAFNSMAAELGHQRKSTLLSGRTCSSRTGAATSRRSWSASPRASSRIGADERIETINGAACRLLAVDRTVIGTPAERLFRARRSPAARARCCTRRTRRAAHAAAHEITLARDGRELHLAAAATPLQGEEGVAAGAVLVFDDVTPLIRTQKVAAWRDVARRLAHEIKNPLTPIQLCAERMQRHFGTAPAPARALVDECTATIVARSNRSRDSSTSSRSSRGCRRRKPVPEDLHKMLDEALALYNGLFRTIRIERRFDGTLPPVRIDVEQIRRVAINLVDNAVEALGGVGAAARPDGSAPTIVVETQHDRPLGVARIVIADNGPGIPAADRDKLFMPYYSTKQRGSGLGLAIVRRIIVEHGGSIEVENNDPPWAPASSSSCRL